MKFLPALNKTKIGFTIIELMVSMAIISILFIGGTTISQQSTQKKLVDQGAVKLEGALQEARANALAGKKVGCTDAIGRLVGWGVEIQPTYLQMYEYCGSFADSSPSRISYGGRQAYSSSSSVIGVASGIIPIVKFKVLGQGVYSSTPFTTTSVSVSGFGWTRTIDVSYSGQVKKNELGVTPPTPTPPPPTSTPTDVPPTPIPTNTPTSTPTNSPTPTPTLPTPMLYWALNENTGILASDSSGHGYTGVLLGNPTWTTGKYGYGLRFDGTGDFVRYTNVFVNPNQPFTISVWVYPTVNAPSAAWLELSSFSSCNGNPQLWAHNSNGTLVFARCGNGAGPVIGSIASFMNGWHHMAFVYSGGVTSSYLDGVAVGGAGVYQPYTWPSISSARFIIGAARDGTQGYTGLMDEARLYNVALSPAQIIQVMNSTN